jgi:uncharacterized membrane protein
MRKSLNSFIRFGIRYAVFYLFYSIGVVAICMLRGYRKGVVYGLLGGLLGIILCCIVDWNKAKDKESGNNQT